MRNLVIAAVVVIGVRAHATCQGFLTTPQFIRPATAAPQEIEKAIKTLLNKKASAAAQIEALRNLPADMGAESLAKLDPLLSERWWTESRFGYGGLANGDVISELARVYKDLTGKSRWPKHLEMLYITGDVFPISVRVIEYESLPNQKITDFNEVLSKAVYRSRTGGQYEYRDEVEIDGKRYRYPTHLLQGLFALKPTRAISNGAREEVLEPSQSVAIGAGKVARGYLARPLLIIRTRETDEAEFGAAGIFHVQGVDGEVVVEFPKSDLVSIEAQLKSRTTPQIAPSTEKPWWKRLIW